MKLIGISEAQNLPFSIEKVEWFENSVGTRIFWLAAFQINGRQKLASNLTGGNFHTDPRWEKMLKDYNADSFTMISESNPEKVTPADFFTMDFQAGKMRLPSWM